MTSERRPELKITIFTLQNKLGLCLQSPNGPVSLWPWPRMYPAKFHPHITSYNALNGTFRVWFNSKTQLYDGLTFKWATKWATGSLKPWPRNNSANFHPNMTPTPKTAISGFCLVSKLNPLVAQNPNEPKCNSGYGQGRT